MRVEKHSLSACFLSRNLFPPNHGKDVFALEFLSHEPHVFMSGGRSGILNITDLRVPESGQQADMIKHQSSITHIKQLDDHRIIVAGLESNLCQYDLRFRKGPNRTQSILQYPEYQNTATIRIGFDIDLESGVVAAAQEHDMSHPPVQLFSLHGGHPLKSNVSDAGRQPSASRAEGFPFISPRYRAIRDNEVVPCVQFVRDREEGRMKSLYTAADVINRYRWESSDCGSKIVGGMNEHGSIHAS